MCSATGLVLGAFHFSTRADLGALLVQWCNSSLSCSACWCILLEHFSTGAKVLDGALLVQTLLLCWGSGAVLHFTTGAPVLAGALLVQVGALHEAACLSLGCSLNKP